MGTFLRHSVYIYTSIATSYPTRYQNTQEITVYDIQDCMWQHAMFPWRFLDTCPTPAPRPAWNVFRLVAKAVSKPSNQKYKFVLEYFDHVDFHKLLNSVWQKMHHFYRASYASTVLAVIVCLSVRPSVTSRSCTKMAKPRIALRTSYDSPGTLVFRCQKSWQNSYDITPNGGAKQRSSRFTSALFHQYLIISQKRCKIYLLLTILTHKVYFQNV